MLVKKMAMDAAANQDKLPVAKLVQEASRFESSIYFELDQKKVNAKSIMGMMGFIAIMNKAISDGKPVEVSIDGPDEAQAMDHMEKYLSGN